MKVTTVTPVYNNEKYLKMCIESLLSDPNDGWSVEHIFVNDGSTDASLRILKQHEGEYVKIIDKPSNEGIAAAYRDALKVAEGDILVFLDADDLAVNGRTGRIVETFQKNEKAGIVYHALEFMDEKGQSLNLVNRLPAYLNNRNWFFHLFKRNYFTGSALAVRNFEWLKSDLDIICCDYYFCLQIAEKGYEFSYIDEPLIRYRIHQHNTSSQSEKMFDSFRQVQSRYPVHYLKERWSRDGYTQGDIYSNLGVMSYYYQKDVETAWRYFHRARTIGTREVHTYFYLGCIYFSNEQYGQALEMFQIACRLDPACFQAIHNIGIIFARVYEDSEKAFYYLQQAKEIQPFYLLIDHNMRMLADDQPEELRIIPVLTDEDNILMMYCKLQAG